MNVAAKVRAEKANHPERFCSSPACLWRIVTNAGPNPCQKHPVPVPPIDLEQFVQATLDGAIGDESIDSEDQAVAAVEFGLMARVQRPLNASERHKVVLAVAFAWHARMASDPNGCWASSFSHAS